MPWNLGEIFCGLYLRNGSIRHDERSVLGKLPSLSRLVSTTLENHSGIRLKIKTWTLRKMRDVDLRHGAHLESGVILSLSPTSIDLQFVIDS